MHNREVRTGLSRKPILVSDCLAALFALVLLAGSPVRAEDPIRIGVLTDESGPYADASGAGSILAAEMAVEDFGGRANGRQVEIVHADTQNKPDVALGIARRWFDRDGVSAIIDLPVTPVANAVQQLAKQSNRTVMITASAASEFTTKTCSLVSTHWADDTHALAAGTAKRLMDRGPADWFFITVDISFGAALQRDATAVIERAGGRVLGSVRHPPNNPDFASQLLQAQASGARYIGLASVGGDLINLIKQAREFGVGQNGKQSLVGFLVYITDIHSLGLQVSQGLTVTSGFYWDQSEPARAFAKRFFGTRKMMPTKNHAEIYAAVTHYLKAVETARSDQAGAVNREMHKTPLDYFGTPATVREDGRVLYDLGLYRVKAPGASKYPWDYYERIGTISHSDAFLAMDPLCAGKKGMAPVRSMSPVYGTD